MRVQQYVEPVPHSFRRPFGRLFDRPLERAISAIRRIGATAVIGGTVLILAGGAYITAENPPFTAPPPPPPPPGSANLWVDTNGGTCTRHSPAAAYVNAEACGTFDAAYDAAVASDLVLVKAGSYGDQTITGTKAGGACDGYTIGASLANCVSIEAEPAASVSVGALSLQANYIRLVDMDAGGIYALHGFLCGSQPPRNTDIVFDNVSTGYMGLNQISNVGVLGGDYGPSEGTIIQMSDCGIGSAKIVDHIRFDGITVHDAIQPDAPDPHLECMQGLGVGTQFVIVRNSKFTNCAQWDISGNFGTTMLLENNQFANPCSGQALKPPGFCSGGVQSPVMLGCSTGFGNVIIRFNDIQGQSGVGFHTSCSLAGTNRIYGNSTNWVMSQFECDTRQNQGYQFNYNVFGTGSVNCGSNGTVAGNQWVNASHPTYDYHLSSCSVASANKVPTNVTGGYPATDYAGVARPQGTNIDAGAYEQCS